MTFRLRTTVVWVALALVGLGVVASLYVLPAMRSDARGKIFARVHALQERGEPLSRAELLPPVEEDPEAARALTELLRDDPFDPWSWEPPEGTGIDSMAFADLVETRMFEDDLDEEERTVLALWIADLAGELGLVRSLLDEPLGGLEEAGSKTPWLGSLPDLLRVFCAEALLAAYEGDVEGVAGSLADAFAVARVNDRHPLAITFLMWVYGRSLCLGTVRRAAELLPADADPSPLVALLDSAEIEDRLRLAFRGERVHYLEALGLVRDGQPTPEDEFVYRRRSPWEPLSWPPYAEWSVLDDLRVLDHLIEGGLSTSEFPLPGRTSGVMRNLVDMDVVASASAHAAEIEELRARLER